MEFLLNFYIIPASAIIVAILLAAVMPVRPAGTDRPQSSRDLRVLKMDPGSRMSELKLERTRSGRNH
jgi:hypothetical protein